MHRNIEIAVGGPINADYPKVYKTKFLKPGIPFGLQVTEPNTKYVIKHNFDLGGGSVTIPEGCLLEFDGGSISNGTLVGQNTILIYNQELDTIFHTVTRQGTFVYNNTVSADEEDITEVGNLLKLKDRGTADGMGKIILRKNKTFAEQLTQTNTIYVIRYDFVLTGNVTIPANCELKFDGGRLDNGTLIGNNTVIDAGRKNIFGTNITLEGTWNITDVFVEWFGAKPNDNMFDSSASIQKAINNFPNKTIVFAGGTYCVKNSIIVPFNANDIYISIGSTIKATANMDELLVIGGSGEVPFFAHYINMQQIYGGGTLDGNWMVNDVLHVKAYSRIHVHDLKIQYGDVLLHTGGPSVTTSIESWFDNLYLNNAAVDDPVNTGIGILCEGNDGRFINISGFSVKTFLKVNSRMFTMYSCHSCTVAKGLKETVFIDIQGDGCVTLDKIVNDSYETFLKVRKPQDTSDRNAGKTTISIGLASIFFWYGERLITEQNLTPVIFDIPNDFDYAKPKISIGTLDLTDTLEDYHNADGLKVPDLKSFTRIPKDGFEIQSVLSRNDRFFEKAHILNSLTCCNKNIIPVYETRGFGADGYLKLGTLFFTQMYDKPLHFNLEVVQTARSCQSSAKFDINLTGNIYMDGSTIGYNVDSAFGYASSPYAPIDTSLPQPDIPNNYPLNLKLSPMYISKLDNIEENLYCIDVYLCYKETHPNMWVRFHQKFDTMGDAIVNYIPVRLPINEAFTEELPEYPTSDWVDVIAYKNVDDLTEIPNPDFTYTRFRIGDKVFSSSLNKPVYWNGSTWVDERGYTANINRGTFTQAQSLVTSNKVYSSDAGFEFYAVDLKKPIYYGGDSKWYDAAGNEVTE